MPAIIGPDVARAAVALRRSHPQVPAHDVLDPVMRQRTGSLDDFGAEIAPGSQFGLLVAEAFDRGMAPQDWLLVNHANSDPVLVAELVRSWQTFVMPRFAAHYVWPQSRRQPFATPACERPHRGSQTARRSGVGALNVRFVVR